MGVEVETSILGTKELSDGKILGIFTKRYERAQKIFGETFLEASKPRVPIDTGNLVNSSYTENGGREVVYPTDYAEWLWNGMVYDRTGAAVRPIHYSSPTATDHWTDKTWAEDGEMILKKVRDALVK